LPALSCKWNLYGPFTRQKNCLKARGKIGTDHFMLAVDEVKHDVYGKPTSPFAAAFVNNN